MPLTQVSRVVHAEFPGGPRLLFENLVDRGKTYVLLAASSGCPLCESELADFRNWTSKDAENQGAYAWVDSGSDDVWAQIRSFQASESSGKEKPIEAPAYFIVENGVLEWRLASESAESDKVPGMRFYDNSGITRDDVKAAIEKQRVNKTA